MARPDALARRSPPPVPSFAIRRMRLEERLDEHPDRHVVLVRGPAGAGKTILVAQWADAHTEPCAWLSIDPTHNDETVLLRQLVEAVEQLSPEGPVVDRRAVATGGDRSVVQDVLYSVTQHLRSRITVVLDDVHRMRDRTARHVLELLVEHPPDDVRVVLISRSKPRLSLERARLRGDLVEIIPAELRFVRDEIDLLASTWTGRHLDAAELEQATLGWAAGLRLAHLDASTQDTPSATWPDSDGIASEYVREEVIDRCSASTRSFLEVGCWLPVLTEPLCAAVAGYTSGPVSLSRPDTEVLPIVPVTSRPGEFRHPPILARVLQQEFCRRDPRAALTARRRAAHACRETGDLVTAIELFLRAACADEAADACADLAATDDSSLRRVDELFRRDPGITPATSRWLVWRIRAAVAAGRVDEACRLLDQASVTATSADEVGAADSPELVVARAVVAEHVGDVTGLLACADRLRSLVEPTGTSECAVARAHGWGVRALVWAGDATRARAAMSELDEVAVGSAPEVAADVALARAWVTWLHGDMSGTAENVAAARPGAGGNGPSSAELALLAGSAHRERNQLAEAVSLLDDAHTLASTASHHVVTALAASELARCHRVTGAHMRALELVVSARAAHPDMPPTVDAHLRSTDVKVRLDQGDVAGAQAALRDAPPGADTQLLAARVALQHAPAQARHLLEAVDACVPRHAVEELLLRAQLPDANPEDESAAIIEAISVGGPLGLVRTFLDEGATLSRRLSQLALDHTDRTLGRLAALACHELTVAPTRRQAGPVEQLTARELAVLRMLPLRMSNREMAAQLYISVNTLKTHVRAIYRKLDVPHRSAAVHRATALQLV